MKKRLQKFRIIPFLSLVLILGCDDDPMIIDEYESTVTISIHDYNYVKRQFFYLETPGDDFEDPEYGFGIFYPSIGGASADSLEVFVSLWPWTEWNTISGPRWYLEAWNDPNNDGDLSDGDMFSQWFYMLYEGKDYDLIPDYSADAATPRYVGIRLRQPLEDYKALAVRYKMDQSGGTLVTVGDYGNYPRPAWFDEPPPDPDPSQTITAELICPPEEDFAPPSTEGARYTSTWNMMFRNVYALNLNLIYWEIVNLEVWSVGAVSGNPATDPYSKEKYLRIFGLDQYDIGGAWGDDGYLDIRPGVLDFANGYIMFPSPQPFNVSDWELQAYFSEVGPPYYGVSDSVKTVVDSLSAHLPRNERIYDEIISWNFAPNIYDIVIEVPR